ARLTEAPVARRQPDAEVGDVHRDVAAGLQACLDRAMLHLCGRFAETTGLRRLALAGGVALNCTANGKLLCSGTFDDIYVQPAAGDDGTALGAALWRAAELGEARNERFPVPFLGPGYGAAAIDAALAAYGDRSEVAPGTELPVMIMTVDVRPEFRDALPAITHVNGSARVQTVAARDNPDFHALLQAVGKTTGREMVLNTSFNVKGQPIVNTPREALDTFLGTGIEFLFLENTLVSRRSR